ncbi:hypothetical protein K445DRAFT_9388 [Daldinia sp. EC12]|nr:hypothetical protein K445DRAFT_9388 [Daldinia sp. EC12]
MSELKSNPTTGELPSISTPEELFDVIAAVKNSNGVGSELASGVPVVDCIQHLYEEIRFGKHQSHQDKLENDFVEATATAVLNHAHNEGSPRLQPKEDQVKAIRRIVFRHGDTILVAPSGYGKTLVTQTVPFIMHERPVIQLCPLDRLGQAQYDALARVPGLRPLLLQGNMQKDKSMWRDVKSGKYTHLILGPDQIVKDPFQTLIRESGFNQGLAMIAVDDLHLVYEWKDYPLLYTNMLRLRYYVPYIIPIFGCTAALSKEAQSYVLPALRFGAHEGGLAFIRTAVERPNIPSIIVSPLPRDTVPGDFRRLHFLLGETLNSGGGGGGSGSSQNTAQAIEKTLVFIDDFNDLVKARYYLMSEAIKMGLTPSEAEKAIRRHDVHTAPGDRQRLLDDFAEEHSPCRILLSTVSLGTGLNIRNLNRVVQFGPLAKGDLAQLLERFAHASRDGETTTAKAYFFVPYWYINALGTHPEWSADATAAQNNKEALAGKPPKIEGAIDDYSDTDSDSSGGSDDSEEDSEREYPDDWTPRDVESNTTLKNTQPYIYDFVHSRCFRQYALNFLQQPGSGDISVPSETCCGACYEEPSRLPIPPPKPRPKKAPPKRTMSWFALQEILAFCEKEARVIRDRIPRCRIDPPPSIVMPTKVRQSMAELFENTDDPDEIRRLAEAVSKKNDWGGRRRLEGTLLDLIPTMYEKSKAEYEKYQREISFVV